MALPPGFIDELRSRTSLAGLIGRRVKLVRRGREYAGLCPFHNEKTPSFYVVEDKDFFHCFGCGAHGDAIGYVMRADNLDFIEAVEKLAGEAGLAVPQQTPQERQQAQRQKTLLEALEAACRCYEAQLWAPAGRAARDYLAGRGLDDETIRRFRLGWAADDRQSLRRALAAEFPEPLLIEAGLLRRPDAGEPYDYFRGRVMFPIGDRAGRVIAFGGRILADGQPKYLNSPDTPLFEKGRVLYGWAAARAAIAHSAGGDEGAGSIIVTEGYMDVIALHRAGFAGAVAPLGTALTEAQLAELWRLAPEPILCFDGDEAGRRAAARAMRRALPLLRPGYSLRFVTLPPGEDPDSFLHHRGQAAFTEQLNAARPLSENLWQIEFDARPTDTPERRADLKRRLRNLVDSIGDTATRSEYWGFISEKFYEVVRSFRLNQLRKRSAGKPHFVGGVPPPLPASPGPTQRTLLFRRLIELPCEITRRVEEITILEVPEPDLEKLRWELLELTEIQTNIDSQRIHEELSANGFGETVGALTARLMRHGLPPSRAGSDPTIIRNEINEMLDLLLNRNAERDIERALRAFEAKPTPENWERLRALIEGAHDVLRAAGGAWL